MISGRKYSTTESIGLPTNDYVQQSCDEREPPLFS
jgi:hypothetical protein